MIDRTGHVYLYLDDSYVGTVFLVLRRSTLAHAAYGQLWDVVCLDDLYLDDEWDTSFDNDSYYVRIA